MREHLRAILRLVGRERDNRPGRGRGDGTPRSPDATEPQRPPADTVAVGEADTIGDVNALAQKTTRPLPPPSSPTPDSAEPPRPGTQVGRFVVLETLGRGGMGVVLAAYDSDLDRRVALKLLAAGAGQGSAGREQLLREARAMARLQHPNVVVVHEVGTVDRQVFLAMEFADGGTLRDWCRAEPRTWREIRAAFLAAGRGLAAAHDAGLVHRDFKPENVLVTRDGTVKVADFGLAGTDATDDAGTIQGTPSYMAPEQHQRERIGPAADQFAFCVALWEALYGELPFRGDSYLELAQKTIEGEPEAPSPGAAAPAWLEQVLRRGLRSEADQRWPSMSSLLAALEDDPIEARRRKLRRNLLAASFAGLAVLASVGLWRGAASRSAPAPCRGAESRLRGIWDPPRRAAVRAAFAASGRDYASDTFDRVAGRLDDYASRWTAAHRDACEATHVRNEQSETALDLRMRCLDDRLGELEALVDVFTTHRDPSVLAKATEATTKLGSIDDCADAEALEREVPLPDDPGLRAQIAGLHRQLDRATALEEAGKYADGLAIARAVTTEAATIDYAPLRAQALLRRGRLERRAGDAASAEQTFMSALSEAAAARDDQLVATIWSELLFAVGYNQARTDDALKLQPIAEAAGRRAGPESEAVAAIHNSLGAILVMSGRYPEGHEEFAQALAMRERVLGPDAPEVARSLNNMGTVLEALGRYDESRHYYQRALALKERILGPHHPSVGDALNNLGVVATKQGRYRDAQEYLERARAVWQEALGPDHASVATAINNLGTLFEAEERPEDARREYLEALALRERALGPDHRHVALTLTGLARTNMALDDGAVAADQAERALRIRQGQPGDPTLVADTELVLAHALWQLGRDRSRARTLAEQARDAYAAAGDRAAGKLADARAWLAEHRAR